MTLFMERLNLEKELKSTTDAGRLFQTLARFFLDRSVFCFMAHHYKCTQRRRHSTSDDDDAGGGCGGGGDGDHRYIVACMRGIFAILHGAVNKII